MHQNQRPGLPLDQEMREDHRLARARRQTHHLAPDPTQGRGLDRGQCVPLIGAELDARFSRSLLQRLRCPHRISSRHEHTVHRFPVRCAGLDHGVGHPSRLFARLKPLTLR